jgi:hypothetical protein
MEGTAFLNCYQFGDKHVMHYFCSVCGICPFQVIAGVPENYTGPAARGYYRLNLGCVHRLDVFALDIELIDGRSF